MIITRKSTTSLLPEAFDILASDYQIPVYNTQYEKRPPLGIYNLSLSIVLDCFDEVLGELDRAQANAFFKDPSKYGWEKMLLERQENLLYAIMSHLDDCMSILRCFFDPSNNGRKKKLNKEPIVENFKNSIENYRTHVGDIVNHIKHHQGRLRAIFIFDDSQAIPGYFVEGVNEVGVLGPYPKIHKLYKNKPTAFSFSRDLKFHMCHLFIISHYLYGALAEIVGANKMQINANYPSEKLIDIFKKVANLPNRFFSDELYQEVPSVRVVEGENQTELQVAYPSQDEFVISLSGIANVWISWISDGISTSYLCPYMKD